MRETTNATPRPPRPPWQQPQMLLLVFVGGCVGTAIRALLEAALPTPIGGWPIMTFIINLTGSFILGALYAALPLVVHNATWQGGLRPALGTGLIGGYTTYSTFIVESLQLGQSLHYMLAAAYMIVSVALGIFLALLGAKTSVALFGKRRGERGDASTHETTSEHSKRAAS